MRSLIFIYSFILSFTVASQTPGNLGATNISGWFKPDGLTLGDVPSWSTTLSTLGTVTVTDAAAPFPQATNTPIGNVSNYNMTLEFSNNTLTNLQALQNTSSVNLIQNGLAASQGTFFCAYYYPQSSLAPSGNNDHILMFNNSPHAIQLRNLGTSGRLALGFGNSTNASRDWTEDYVPNIISYKGNRSTSTSLSGYERDLLMTTPITASASSGSTGIYIGVQPSVASSPYNGYIHELIFYDVNLTAPQMRKVHTYLAIKYGITLDNAGGGVQGDYLSSDSTTIWDASVNPSYHHDVIGIGRDDDQGILQKQSHSFTDNYRIYLNTLAANNVSNSGSFNNNMAFVTMGQNTDGSCGNTASNTESPAGISSRIAKEWKVQNTNFTQNFNWDAEIDTCTLIGYQVGMVDPSLIRLLVDNDGDFSNATAYAAGGGLNFSYANGYVTVTGISNLHLPEDSIRYFTLGYNTTTVGFSGNNAICTGQSTTITVNINNAAGPLNVQYTNGVTTTTLTGISNGYTFTVTPTATTTYSVIGYSSFMNCCGGAGSSNFTVTVTPYPTVNANASNTSLCAGQNTVLSSTGASSYQWFTLSGTTVTPFTNLTQSPTNTTTYYVVGQNAGCADTGSVTVVVHQLPTVTATSSATPVCRGTQVTLTASGAVNYVWSNGLGNTNIVTATPNTSLPSLTYNVQGTDANNCIATTSVTVAVWQLPNVVANATDNVICEGESISLFGSGAQTYSWTGPVAVTNNVSFVPPATGTYTVTGTDANSCQKTATINIVVNQNPVVSATASPSTICAGQKSKLLANGAINYLWIPFVINGDSVAPSITTTYTVVGTNAANCIDSASVTITVNPLPNVVANANPQEVCEGNETTLSGTGAVNYIWSNGVIDNVSFVPDTTTTYFVVGTDGNNCSNLANVTVIVHPKLDFNAGPDTVTCPQNPITLFADLNFESYLWSNGSTNFFATIGEIGPVYLTVVDNHGCEYTDTIVLNLADDCFPTYTVPNVFSPNGDEVNDFFFIEAFNISEQTMTIFNRWGNIMYSNTSTAPSYPIWDGKTLIGAVAEDGVYFVKYELKANNGETITGTSYLHLISK